MARRKSPGRLPERPLPAPARPGPDRYHRPPLSGGIRRAMDPSAASHWIRVVPHMFVFSASDGAEIDFSRDSPPGGSPMCPPEKPDHDPLRYLPPVRTDPIGSAAVPRPTLEIPPPWLLSAHPPQWRAAGDPEIRSAAGGSVRRRSWQRPEDSRAGFPVRNRSHLRANAVRASAVHLPHTSLRVSTDRLEAMVGYASA